MTRMKRSLSWALALILSLSLLPLPLAHAADRPTVASSIMAQAAAPGKPVVNALSSVYGTGDRVVVSWSAASSTMLPRYMTPIRSEMYLTTDRSWVINR